ncbi:MAG: xanthine dehydrogenase family protein subunit M [Dehalococcoidia bacterium]|nr:xanthine dehydrogenase family protein subunit M [Dehalococcoidia bacterium]
MEAFDYLAPRSLAEVYDAIGNGRRSLLLAGGTDVIVQLREGRRSCDQLIDIKHIEELTRHAFTPDGTLEIGAATPLAELYEDTEVRRRVPALVDAISIIGGIAIQSRASIGGNVCNASPAADSTPALIALGATLLLGSKSGNRELPVEEFVIGPGRNALQPGEILLQVRIPAPAANSGAFYHRFIPRNEMDIAVASAGVSLALDANSERIESARVALGAVAATPLLVPAAAEALQGQAPTTEIFAKAGEAAAAMASPITDMRGSVAQRKHLAKVLTVRALERALQRSREAR